MVSVGDIVSGKDDYEVTQFINSSGFGETFFVNRLSDNKICVATFPRDAAPSSFSTPVHSEFKILDDLKQKNVPNVVRAIEVIEYQNQVGNMVPVLVTEAASGESLVEVMARGPMAEDHCLEIITKIAEAVNYIHEAGYIHRDIVPDEIFVEDIGGRNNVTILDFRIAAPLAEDKVNGITNLIAGRSFYSPPEQLDASRGSNVSIYNDIFGTGATAVALLLGQPGFDKFRSAAPTPPYDMLLLVPDELSNIDNNFRDIIYKSTSYEPSDRFATMADMVDALRWRES